MCVCVYIYIYIYIYILHRHIEPQRKASSCFAAVKAPDGPTTVLFQSQDCVVGSFEISFKGSRKEGYRGTRGVVCVGGLGLRAWGENLRGFMPKVIITSSTATNSTSCLSASLLFLAMLANPLTFPATFFGFPFLRLAGHESHSGPAPAGIESPSGGSRVCKDAGL